jgi:hypothetical protein
MAGMKSDPLNQKQAASAFLPRFLAVSGRICMLDGLHQKRWHGGCYLFLVTNEIE